MLPYYSGRVYPEAITALEDAIKSHYAWASSESRDTTGRLNPMRLYNSIAAVTGYDGPTGEDVPPQEADVASPEDNGEEPQTAEEPADEAEAASPTDREEASQPDDQADSESNNGAPPESNGTREEGGYANDADPEYRPGDVVAAAAVTKAQGKAKAGQPSTTPASGSGKNQDVKINDLGTGADSQRSQQNRPRMSDLLHGGKPEGAVMNDEKENAALKASGEKEPEAPSMVVYGEYDSKVTHAGIRAALEDFGNRIGRRIIILGGSRTPAENKKFGGASNSSHLTQLPNGQPGCACAVDFTVEGLTIDQAARLADQATGPDGQPLFKAVGNEYGAHPHVHVDMRPGPNFRFYRDTTSGQVTPVQHF